jgi:hypothetical protein
MYPSTLHAADRQLTNHTLRTSNQTDGTRKASDAGPALSASAEVVYVNENVSSSF